jgi:hypothetical protein
MANLGTIRERTILQAGPRVRAIAGEGGGLCGCTHNETCIC